MATWRMIDENIGIQNSCHLEFPWLHDADDRPRGGAVDEAGEQASIPGRFATVFSLQANAKRVVGRRCFTAGPQLGKENLQRIFVTYVAQVARGRAGGVAIETILQVQTLLTLRVTGRIRFVDQSGQPLVLTIDGAERSEIDLDLPVAGSARFLVESGDGPPQAGYVCIESNYPLTASAVYRITSGSSPIAQQSGLPISEAGVASDQAKTFHAIAVERLIQEGVDTGIAVANTGQVEARINFLIVEEDGNFFPDGILNGLILDLDPGEQVAFFLSEYCQVEPAENFTTCRSDFLSDSDFRGSIYVQSNQPTAVTTLRTIDGLPRSSLPSGSTQ